MPEYSYIQTFSPIDTQYLNETLYKFSLTLKELGVWNIEIENGLNSFEWIVEDGAYVYSTTSNFKAIKSDLEDLQIKPFVLGRQELNQNQTIVNFLALELLIESEYLRSLRMWRYYPSTFIKIRIIANILNKHFADQIIYFTDEAQDNQEFELLLKNNKQPAWKFDYALIPNQFQSLYKMPPETHRIVQFENYFEVFFKDKWENKNLESISID